MTKTEIEPYRPATSALDTMQNGRVDWRLGKSMQMSVQVEITPTGLLAIGGMVAMILLSSAQIVKEARRRS